jgi:hypothetical protein
MSLSIQIIHKEYAKNTGTTLKNSGKWQPATVSSMHQKAMTFETWWRKRISLGGEVS